MKEPESHSPESSKQEKRTRYMQIVKWVFWVVGLAWRVYKHSSRLIELIKQLFD